MPSIKINTTANPLQFAIKGIKATSTAESQSGSGLNKLFDFDESNGWHTKWDKNAIPFDIVMDLKSMNQLEKIQYLPRSGGGNGVLLKGTVFYSNNKSTWTEVGNLNGPKMAIQKFSILLIVQLHVISNCRLPKVLVILVQEEKCMYLKCREQKVTFRAI